MSPLIVTYVCYMHWSLITKGASDTKNVLTDLLHLGHGTPVYEKPDNAINSVLDNIY